MTKKDEDMSNTFISEVGQKSAIAGENTISLEDVKDELNGISEATTDHSKETVAKKKDDQNSFHNHKPKKRNPIGIIFLMILCLLLGAGGTYYYFEVMNKKQPQKLEDNNIKKEEKEEELNPDGVYIRSLIADYDFSLIDNMTIYEQLYSREKTEIKDIDEYYLRNLVGIKAQRSLENRGFSGDDFQDSVKLLFGPHFVLENKDLSDNADDAGRCYSYKYNEESKNYEFQEPMGCGGTSPFSLKRKIIKATKDKEKIKINIAVAIVDSESKKVYRSYKEGVGVGDEVEKLSIDRFDMDKDYDQVNQYQYLFQYDLENNHYYLVSIEKIK